MIPGIAEQIKHMAREHREDQERRAARNAVVQQCQKKSVATKKVKFKKEIK